MKKRSVINLIRYHQESNDAAFRSEALIIAKEFYEDGDNQILNYIIVWLSVYILIQLMILFV